MIRSRNLIVGGLLCLIVVSSALVSFVWTPYDITQLDIPNKLQSPNSEHWLGTDHFGRDIFSMIMIGARTSLAVALVAVVIGMGLGVPWAYGRLPTKVTGWMRSSCAPMT